MKGPKILKNKFISLPIITTLILCLLVGGCASPNPSQQVNSTHTQASGQPNPIQTPPTYPTKLLKVHFIDVGQGDAILIQTPDGQNMLVDAGENDYGDVVVNYLISQGVKDLDIVLGTHPHSDHIGGLDTVIKYFPIKYIYMPKATNNTDSFRDVLNAVKNKGLKISTAKAGVVLPLDGVNCRFVAPVKDSYEELNNYSGVIRLDYGSQSFLLTGDAGTESEAQMLSSGVNIKSTVLKVGHHGSYSSSSSRFLKAAAPQYAVIMAGKDNQYEHPHAQTLTRLTNAGINIYRSDQDGTILFATDGKDMQVSQSR
ncbi:MAG: MBL fold metallo-hydrolase [Firmicutes bacterium HGW-Firmicutes-15]|nr:MAG: MBL fold metallo-hydrolase [Firmicutes bacterium HGW-Firmicutes-15]